MRHHTAKGVLSIGCMMLGGAVWASSHPSSAPHMDHEPKHGGVFFMAPDRTHHLEGVLLPAGTFKVYLYDDYTRPIPATGFEALMQLDGPAEARKLKLFVDSADGTLSIRDLPVKQFPVDITVWITFPGRSGGLPHTELFSFSFDGFSRR
jgi:hypothetical protein